MVDKYLADFVRESNRIEGILRDPTTKELEAAADFLGLPDLVITDVEELVGVFQPGAKLRVKPSMSVVIGDHFPPEGGEKVVARLDAILRAAVRHTFTPWQLHIQYETLHPFMDGNGRSGRMIWLWQMVDITGGVPRIGFLHTFYYQTLEASHLVPENMS